MLTVSVAGATACSNNTQRWLWVPAFVRRDDKGNHHVGEHDAARLCPPTILRSWRRQMNFPIQLSDSLALRAKMTAIHSSVGAALDRFVASLLAMTANAISHSRGAVLPGLLHHRGTGSYLLDFFAKTPVREIRAFDGDTFHVHNAFRSPGTLEEGELGGSKAETYRKRYTNFRAGLIVERKYIDRSSAADFAGVTFAFVCVDKDSARSEVFDLLMSLRIPFIDVGMGLKRKQGGLSGAIRVTHYSADEATNVRGLQLAEMADNADDIYRTNVQIAELNALNASIAMIRYKQLRGFYTDDNRSYHWLMDLGNLRAFAETQE
jgi:hypothetical protein